MEETYNVKFIVRPKEKAKHEGNMLTVLEKFSRRFLGMPKVLIHVCKVKFIQLCVGFILCQIC